jgi:glycosyltransferase involved in cell wall biosynthesis
MTCISIVTPSLNSAATIDETILSVVTQQGDFAIEYHVQDGGSTDATPARLQRWSEMLEGRVPFPAARGGLKFSYSIQKDGGMYEAINHGFSSTSGEVMTWINSDDRLETAALQAIVHAMRDVPSCRWITGARSTMRSDGIRLPELPATAYARELVAAGLHDGEHLPYIQQEGTFWARSLWEEAGGRLRDDLEYAGDFDLWMRLAEYGELFTCEVPLGCFRQLAGQKTGDLHKYNVELERHRSKVRGPEVGRIWRRYLEGDTAFSGKVVSFESPEGPCRARVCPVRYRSLWSIPFSRSGGTLGLVVPEPSQVTEHGITIDRNYFAGLAQRSALLEDIERDRLYRIRRRMLYAEKRVRSWFSGLYTH